MVQSRLLLIVAITFVVFAHAIGIYSIIHMSDDKLKATSLKGQLGVTLTFEMIEQELYEPEIVEAPMDAPEIIQINTDSLGQLRPSAKSVKLAKVGTPKKNKVPPSKHSSKKKERKSTSASPQKKEGSNKSSTQNKIGQGQQGMGSGRSSEAGFGLGSGKKSVQKSIDRCYPLISIRRGEEGTALLRVHLGTKNNVTSVTLIKSTGFSRLDQCAIKAAKEAKYESKLVNGKPVESYYEFPLTFELKDRK